MTTDSEGVLIRPEVRDSPVQAALRELKGRHQADPPSVVDAYLAAVAVLDAHDAVDVVSAWRSGRGGVGGAGSWPTSDARRGDRSPTTSAGWRLGAAFGLVSTSLLAGCGGHSAGLSSGRVVRVTERDFRIQAPHELRVGLVRFVITNHGPSSHELILVRAPDGRLPMRKDGFTVDEEALASRIVGALEAAEPGIRRELDARLGAGRYVLFCNMAGHYLSGMSSALLVR